jgi:hypothetical protein
MANYGFDVDGTIDSFPYIFEQMMGAFVAKGDRVWIITGIGAPTVTQADIDAKTAYLASMGISSALYSDLIVLPIDDSKQGGHAQGKAKVLAENKIDVLFDNNAANIKAAAAIGVVALLLQNSKVKN